MQNNGLIVGIISDTHGTLADGAAEVLSCADLIVHAGDIGKPAILDDLGKIAPVVPVKGNMDSGEWTAILYDSGIIEKGGVLLYVIHDISKLALDPATAGFSAVIHGHTHKPLVEKQNGVLFINPGSASLPPTGHHPSVALLEIKNKKIFPRLISLK